MIGISYYHHGSMTFNVNVFEKEEDAKEWIIRECMDNIKIITYWYDDDEDVIHDTPEGIENCLQKLSLDVIIIGIEQGGGIEIKIVRK